MGDDPLSMEGTSLGYLEQTMSVQARPHNPDSTRSPIDIILVTTVSIAITSLLIRQFHEPDIWWHLAIGKDILRNLLIPVTDHYSLAGWGRPYHDSHWLFQVIVALLEKIGGLAAVGIMPAVIWSATLFICYQTMRRWVDSASAAIMLGIVAVACHYRFIPRPDIVTCLFISLFYQLLHFGRFRTAPQLLFICSLQIVWSNSHGLFVIGPFMASCYLAEAAWKSTHDPSVRLYPTLRLTIFLFLASLCTPFPFKGWQYAFQLAQEAGPGADSVFKTIGELTPLYTFKSIDKPEFWAFAIIVLLLIPMGWALARRRKLPLARAIIVIALLGTSIMARRNIPLFCLTAAPFLAEASHCIGLPVHLRRTAKIFWVLLFIVLTWSTVSGSFYRAFGYDPVRFGIGSPAHVMPTGLLQKLKEIEFSGQIYNNDRFGGFCLYHGYLPLVDGRWEVYEQETLNAILSAPYDSFLWRAVINRYDISGVLLENGLPETNALISRFLQDSSFQMIYSDAVSSFWIRNINL